jgi:hypothetical protein
MDFTKRPCALHFSLSELMKKRYIRTLILLEDEICSRGTGKTAYVLHHILNPFPQIFIETLWEDVNNGF